MLKRQNPPELSWQKSPSSPSARQVKIFSLAFRLLFNLWFDRITNQTSSVQKHRRAKWLVKAMLNLGPTFIKIGQALSTRADLIPLEYVQEFIQLQDKVPAFSSDKAIKIIESELGKEIYAVFRDFNPNPLAAASLGQVHQARLHTGEDVVVKVQRPGLETIFNLDFEVLHRLVRFVNRFFPAARKYHLEAIYQEFFELLYLEIDYIHEGRNAERFRENFQGFSRVVIPKVYWQYSTKKILTLEYLPGTKIDDRASLEAQNINTQEVIQLGITCYLKQLLQDGFFQSDPHPGNMAINHRGEIIFYDFGTMTEVKLIAKEQMITTFFAVLKKDTDTVVETLIYMGLIEPLPDMSPVKKLVAFILEQFTEKPIDVNAFEQMSSEIYLMFEQQPFRLPPQMTFIIKAVTTLDGIARSLDPQYNFLAATKPFVKNYAISNNKRSLIGAIAKQTKNFVQYKLNQPNATEIAIQRLESRLDRGELQVRVRSIESDRLLKKIYLGIKCLVYASLSGFTLLAGIGLLLGFYLNWAIALFTLSGFWFLCLIRSLMKLVLRERLDRLAQK